MVVGRVEGVGERVEADLAEMVEVGWAEVEVEGRGFEAPKQRGEGETWVVRGGKIRTLCLGTGQCSLSWHVLLCLYHLPCR